MIERVYTDCLKMLYANCIRKQLACAFSVVRSFALMRLARISDKTQPKRLNDAFYVEEISLIELMDAI